MVDLKDDDRNKAFSDLFFYAFLVLFAFFLIYTTYKINISEDETYTLNTTSRSLEGVIKQSYNFEAQPPVYFILISWWRLICSGIFFTKLFSLVFIGLSGLVFYRLTSLFVTNIKSSYYLVTIFLLNPFTVWAGLEIRLYAFLIFLSTVSIYFFFRYYFEENKKFLYLFFLVSLIGVYTQYFFVFLIASLSFIILIQKSWNIFLKFFFYLIPLILLFLPNLQFLHNQISLQETHNINQFSFSKVSAIFYTPQSLILAINLVPNVWLNRLVRILFLITILIIYLKLYKRHLTKSILFFKKYNIILLLIFILLILFCISFFITGVGYENKYMAVVFPLFILLFTIFDQYSFLSRSLIYASAIIYFIILLSIKYWHPVKTYDFISTAKFIKKIEKKDEPILIYRPAIALPLNHYYNGKNKIIPIPHPVNFDSSYLINIKDTLELKRVIENSNSRSKSYILVSDTTVYEGILNMNRKMISKYIYNHYKVSMDTLFYGQGKKRPLRIMSFEKSLYDKK